jgi:hypothetical protein
LGDAHPPGTPAIGPAGIDGTIADCRLFDKMTVAVAVAIVKARMMMMAATTGDLHRWAVSSATACLRANSKSVWVQAQGGLARGKPSISARAF